MVASLTYMWWAKVPDAPLGKKELRPILVLRGLGGFFGGPLIFIWIPFVSYLLIRYSLWTLLWVSYYSSLTVDSSDEQTL